MFRNFYDLMSDLIPSLSRALVSFGLAVALTASSSARASDAVATDVKPVYSDRPGQEAVEFRVKVDRMGPQWAHDLLGADSSLSGRLMTAWAWAALTGEGAKALFDWESSQFDGFAAHSQLSRALLSSPSFLRSARSICQDKARAEKEKSNSQACFDRLVLRIQRSQFVGSFSAAIWASVSLGVAARWVYSVWFKNWFATRLGPLVPRALKGPLPVLAAGSVLTAGSVAWSFHLNEKFNLALADSTQEFISLMQELDQTRLERSQVSVLKAHREQLALWALEAFEWVRSELETQRIVRPSSGPMDLDLSRLPNRAVLSREIHALRLFQSELRLQFEDQHRVSIAHAVETRIQDQANRKGRAQNTDADAKAVFDSVSPDELKLWVDYQTGIALGVILPLLERAEE